MSQNLFLVHASKPSGKNRRIELAGIDLWRYIAVHNVFVYPSAINIEKFKQALADTLSDWPFVAGVGLIENNDHYIIEMSDQPIPVTFEENKELNEWPLDSNIIVGLTDNPLPKFYDPVVSEKTFDNVSNEPLIRFKITHIVKSDEWVLGFSWSHTLGDAASILHFLTDLSRVYQNLELSKPLPIFERPLWSEDQADSSFYQFMKQHRDAKSAEEVYKLFMTDSGDYSLTHLQFSGDQIKRLRSFVDDAEVTTHDCLIAYLITILNRYLYETNDERRVLRTNNAVNFRGVSDSIAPPGLVSNGVMMMLSENFEDPFSINTVAKAIRKSIQCSRQADYLRTWVATVDQLSRRNTKNHLFPDLGIFQNEITVNSNYRYDWVSAVDFGQTDRCRFYTAWAGPLYFRVFRLNPRKNGDSWLPRDRDGAEVAFQIEKEYKDKLVDAIQRDMDEDFSNIQK